MKKILILSLCSAVLFTGTVSARDHDAGQPPKIAKIVDCSRVIELHNTFDIMNVQMVEPAVMPYVPQARAIKAVNYLLTFLIPGAVVGDPGAVHRSWDSMKKPAPQYPGTQCDCPTGPGIAVGGYTTDTQPHYLYSVVAEDTTDKKLRHIAKQSITARGNAGKIPTEITPKKKKVAPVKRE
jgi:hypothetical protein